MKNSQILRMKVKEVVGMLLITRREPKKLGLKKTRRRQRTRRQVRLCLVTVPFSLLTGCTVSFRDPQGSDGCVQQVTFPPGSDIYLLCLLFNASELT